jgi:hypothetical protein
VKDKGLKLITMIVDLKLIVNCKNLGVVEIFEGICFGHVFSKCHNPSFGLATKAKGLQGCGPRESLGVTSHTPESVGKSEGMNLHTPKVTPTLGDGVLQP